MEIFWNRFRCAAVLVLAAFACSLSFAQPIKIGAFVAVTGPASFLGDPQAKTLRLYTDKINAAGGVQGRKLELVLYDTQGEARQAVSFVRRLIEDDQVDILIGGSTTGETMAVAPMVEKAAIPFISMAGASVVVEPVKKWIFKTPASDRMAIERIYTDMASRGLLNVGLIAGSGGFDQSCRAEAKSLAARHGIKLVADETYAATDNDMTPQFSRINSAKAQAILNCGFGSPVVIAARNYKQLGLTQPAYFTHGVGSQQFVDGAKGAAEGARITVAAVLVADQLAEDDSQRKVVKSYADDYRTAYNERASAFGGFAYDALYIALGAMQRAGSTDKAKVRDEIERTRNFVGIDGVFNMSESDHMGLKASAFKLTEIRNGDWQLLK